MSTCELSPDGSPASAASRVTLRGSRLHRFRQANSAEVPHHWDGIPLQQYKAAADHHCGVLRSVLVGDSGELTRFHLRYFEISPGGNTSLEHHQHEHVVVVLRGQGQVRLDASWHELHFGDTVYIAPGEVHQLRNSGTEPFGFLCLVDADRDRPRVMADPSGLACER